LTTIFALLLSSIHGSFCGTYALGGLPSQEDLVRYYEYEQSLPLDVSEEMLVDESGYRILKVYFDSVNGERVPGLLSLPEKEEKVPCVVFLHGYGGNKDDVLVGARLIAKEGYAIISIDAEYHGERREEGKELYSPNVTDSVRGKAVCEMLGKEGDVSKRYMLIAQLVFCEQPRWGCLNIPMTMGDDRMEKVRYAGIEKLRGELAARKAEFERQLKEVQKRYPLVAIAYGLQAAVIAERSSSCALAYVGIAGPLHTSLTLDADTATRLSAKSQKAWADFDRACGRATTDSEALDAINVLTSSIHC